MRKKVPGASIQCKSQIHNSAWASCGDGGGRGPMVADAFVALRHVKKNHANPMLAVAG